MPRANSTTNASTCRCHHEQNYVADLCDACRAEWIAWRHEEEAAHRTARAALSPAELTAAMRLFAAQETAA
jgi:hypothetical protein